MAGFDYVYEPFQMPTDLKLHMVDVNSGSDTKVLVSAVLNWEKQNRGEAQEMFSGYNFVKLKGIYEEVKKLLVNT